MRYLIVLVLAVLAGCATPEGIMRTGTEQKFRSERRPPEVANCFARNVVHSGGVAPVVTVAPNGDYEVSVIRLMTGLMETFMVIAPAENGSSVTARMAGHRGDVSDLMKGC